MNHGPRFYDEALPPGPPIPPGPVLRAVVVRHAGNLTGRTPLFGPLRRCLDQLVDDPPAPDLPLLGVVVEEAGATLLWLPEGDPVRAISELSRRDWRQFV